MAYPGLGFQMGIELGIRRVGIPVGTFCGQDLREMNHVSATGVEILGQFHGIARGSVGMLANY